MSAAIGDWPFWTASGGVVRLECGEAVGGGGDMKDAAVAMDIFIPSDEDGNHDCASPLILGGPASPSGSGDGFLFLAARAPVPTQESGKRKMLKKYSYGNMGR